MAGALGPTARNNIVTLKNCIERLDDLQPTEMTFLVLSPARKQVYKGCGL